MRSNHTFSKRRNEDMFWIKNAIKNIYRYRSKYILFGILYLTVISAASVCVNIFVQMGQITDNIIKEYANIVRIGLDPNLKNGELFKKRLTKEEISQLKNLDHVEDIKYLRYAFASNNINSFTAWADNAGEYVSPLKIELYVGGKLSHWPHPLEPIIVLGYNMSIINLAADDFNLAKGRMFENDGEAVIAQNNIRKEHDIEHGYYDSGQFNNWEYLDLGDKIIIRNDDGMYKEFTVVGIQAQNNEEDHNTFRNFIYTTLESAEYFDVIASKNWVEIMLNSMGGHPFRRIEGRDYVRLGHDALIYLDDPKNFTAFEKNMHDMGFEIEPLFPNFRPLINLTKTMQNNAAGFMAISMSIIMGVAIISTAILLNARKYEIAVFRSTGMKKSRLMVNYLIENFAFIWGISIFALMIAPFIAKLLLCRIFEGMREFVSGEMLEILAHGSNLELMLKNMGIVFGGTIAVVMLSLILACINIIRFEPLKIFNKQY